MVDESLMQAFDFVASDLSANQERYITKQQRRKLSGKRRSEGILYLVGTVALIGFGISLILQNRQFTSDLLIIPGCSAFAALIVAILGYLRWQDFSRDLLKGDVTSVEGLIFLEISSGPRGSLFGVKVGDKHWTLSKDQCLALSNRHQYRFYYSPNSKTILSIEALDY